MKKTIASGVPHKSPKVPMVDPKGAFTKVKERTVNTKSGPCKNCKKKLKNKK